MSKFAILVNVDLKMLLKDIDVSVMYMDETYGVYDVV